MYNLKIKQRKNDYKCTYLLGDKENSQQQILHLKLISKYKQGIYSKTFTCVWLYRFNIKFWKILKKLFTQVLYVKTIIFFFMNILNILYSDAFVK